MGKIIFYIGPSSSGKDTFYKYTSENYDISDIVLYTTRPIREGEKEGVNYFYITKEKMNDMEKKGMLIERRDYNTKYGIWSYATSRYNIKDNTNYLTLNTWDGYKSFNNYYDDNKLLPVYFMLDPKVRLERALKRESKEENPKYDEVERRFKSDLKDYRKELIDIYKPYIIDNNGTIDDTKEQIDDLMEKKLIKKRK